MLILCDMTRLVGIESARGRIESFGETSPRGYKLNGRLAGEIRDLAMKLFKQ